jgi:hypothetical protein
MVTHFQRVNQIGQVFWSIGTYAVYFNYDVSAKQKFRAAIGMTEPATLIQIR